MKNTHQSSFLDLQFILIALFVSCFASAQFQNKNPNLPNNFLDKVQFGGGLGLSLGNGYTDISISPSAIYNVNQYFSAGLGVQYTYAKLKNSYTSNLYGGSVITLFNPLPEIQLSAELEQLRVNVTGVPSNNFTENFWNTALFLGAGYRSSNATIGIRYNVLYKENNLAYNTAFMPFVRFYF
ncbi:hypothetical protein FFWV33_03055 [Flavobacterium faecale]|uniref:Alpha-ketoglutarate decarboxylase n=1 Tax=Flavobacterium faecale TaxID=1355330 RepID=A0A2S1L9Z5_9FLAO|nr:hypothetical protein [Flavobacterium faecale]AWG20583.1 hypothetical protein FFWV33_03055 [Flavobacterium faecale]